MWRRRRGSQPAGKDRRFRPPTPRTLSEDYEEVIGEDRLSTTNALSLNNISEERESAFLDQIASRAAVILLGQLAMKASKDIDFPMPVVIVGACGESGAAGPVIAVCDADSEPGDGYCGSAVSVSSLDSFALAPESLQRGARTAITCEGISLPDMLSRVLSEIARLKK